MELNNFDQVLGVVATEDITEGRFVLLCDHSWTYDFGSKEDLPGVKLPDTDAESAKAKFIITWPVDNRKTPIYQPNPSLAWALRDGGFDQAANSPFTPDKVYLTYPGYTDSEVIPSGNTALGFTEGTFTLPFGDYVYDTDIIVPGAALAIANTGTDGASAAGKPKYAAAVAAGFLGFTERYDSVTGALTIRVE